MALKITAVQRASAAPCDHWNITIVNEVQSITRQVKGIPRSEFDKIDSFDGPYWVLLALLWLRARLDSGNTVASCVNVEIL